MISHVDAHVHFISTGGALRPPSTYDNHPIHPICPICPIRPIRPIKLGPSGLVVRLISGPRRESVGA